MVSAQLPVPLQSPPQPTNVQPGAGVAARVSAELWPKTLLQLLVQLTLPVPLLTVPLPVMPTLSW